MLSFANLSGYGAKLDQLIQELNEDIIEITGQSNPVKLILTQVGTHVSYARYPRIPMVQLDRANVNPNIILARMMYNSDFVADEVHGTTQCYGLTGAKLGLHFVKNIMNGENYTPWINPVGHVFNLGTLTSTLTFNVPTPPLVIDTTEVQGGSDALYDNYGFELYNVVEDETTLANNSIHKATTRITNVQVTGPSTIVVTYDSEPSVGTRLVYGHNGFGWDRVTGGYNTALSSAGRVNGNRGNIRDSMGEIYQYNVRDSSGTVMHDKLHNWCPIFEIVF
jgi:hypothetical protein